MELSRIRIWDTKLGDMILHGQLRWAGTLPNRTFCPCPQWERRRPWKFFTDFA